MPGQALAPGVLVLALQGIDAVFGCLWFWLLLALAVTDWRAWRLPDPLLATGLAMAWCAPFRGGVAEGAVFAAGTGAVPLGACLALAGALLRAVRPMVGRSRYAVSQLTAVRAEDS